MATLITKPPALAGSSSRAAYTASSWSLASARSMVTSGSARQSSGAGRRPRLGGLCFCCCRGGKHVRDRMGVDGDEADRALGRERAELFRHARAGKPIAAPARGDLDRHQVAIARVGAGAGWDRKLVAELLLVDRREPPAAIRRRAINAEHALPGAVDELDAAPRMADRIVLFAALLDPQQGTVADAGDLAWPRAARNAHADLGRGAVLDLVPLGGKCDQLAVGIARGDVGDH